MLNLNDPVRYTPAEVAHVKNVLKPQGKAGWKDQKNLSKDIRNKIDTHTIIAQGGRCAYCETPLLKGCHAVEHIAPKGLYGEFCYEPQNLVNACTSCNSTSNKGEKNTVAAPVDKNDYTNNQFLIVHPYFDNPDDHLKYMDADKTVFDMTNCSVKGKYLIDIMNWNESWAYTQRVMTSMIRGLHVDVIKLVNEISTYRR